MTLVVTNTTSIILCCSKIQNGLTFLPISQNGSGYNINCSVQQYASVYTKIIMQQKMCFQSALYPQFTISERVQLVITHHKTQFNKMHFDNMQSHFKVGHGHLQCLTLHECYSSFDVPLDMPSMIHTSLSQHLTCSCGPRVHHASV